MVQDEVDDREGVPRLCLAEFLQLFHLHNSCDSAEANTKTARLVANLIAHIRALPPALEYLTRRLEVGSFERLSQEAATSRRIVLFVRFLGLPCLGIEPLPLEALNTFLAGERPVPFPALIPALNTFLNTRSQHLSRLLASAAIIPCSHHLPRLYSLRNTFLACAPNTSVFGEGRGSGLIRCRKGLTPLLPVSGERVEVPVAEVLGVLDWAFSGVRQVLPPL